MLLLNRKYDDSIERELGNFRYGHGSRQLNINRGRFAACEKKKRKKRKIETMFIRVHLSRERFLVDARTVVYLNIAIEEKRRKNFAASVPRIGRVGNITLEQARFLSARTDCTGKIFIFLTYPS